MQSPRLIDQLMPLAPPELRAGDADGLLRFVNELLEATIDAVAAHIAILDERGTVIAVNRAWREFAESNGAPPGDYGLGLNYVRVCRAAAGESALGAGDVADGLEAVLAGQREHFYLRYPCHSPNENRWFQVRVNRFRVAGLARVVVAHENISETMEIEERLLLEHVNFSHAARLASLGEMAAGIAHELNQPLAAIANYANGCLRRLRSGAPADPNVLVEGIERIADQALRAGEIIKRLRAFARRGDLPSTDVDLAQVIRRAIELCKPEAAREGVVVEFHPVSDIPRAIADRIQIEQVLVNLIKNGIEAISDAKSERCRITIAARPADGMVRVEVADTGPGIDPAIRSRLFDPFATTKPNGMGLGLSLSQSMIAASGGRLSLESTGPDGTTFAIAIPIAPPGRPQSPTLIPNRGSSQNHTSRQE
ncbi:MAG: sensor histidine kinase [Phycisphaerales bacterium]